MRTRLLAFVLAPLMACGDGGGNGDNDGLDGGGMDTSSVDDGTDTDGDGVSDADEGRLGTDPNNADTDGDGVRDGDEVVVGTNPTVADEPCANVSAEASLVKKPVDIIFVIDNSGSMSGEILKVQENISTNFAEIIGASGLDYRIIMLAKHGNVNPDESICISAPLSGTDCDPIPAQPANNPPLFYHYSQEIDSHDSLVRILQHYADYDQWLREGAVKVFVEITDDEATGETAATFDTKLLALSEAQFGTAADRNYVFHSIVGLAENDPVTKAWEPTDPEQPTLCTTAGDNGAVAAGVEYQKLSILTGGLRFPICYLDSFDTVFQAIAQGVIDRVEVECSFGAPEGESLDLSRVALVYTPGDGSEVQSFDRVDDETACATDGFYLSEDTFHLCPSTCESVQGDSEAQLDILVGCETSVD